MFTTVAFFEDQDPAGAYVGVAAIADQHIQATGDELTVPELNHIVAIMGGAEQVAANRMRLVSPTLRKASMYQVNPLNGATAGDVTPQSPPAIIDLRQTPLVVKKDEALECFLLSNPAAAQMQWCIVWLSNGPIQPVKGDIFTVRGTSATALVAEAWTNVQMTLDEDLQPGRYQCVGFRGISAGGVAFRLVPRGGPWRPGSPGAILTNNLDSPLFRYGNMGVFCEFPHNILPSVDGLSILADAAQEFFLDLIQVG